MKEWMINQYMRGHKEVTLDKFSLHTLMDLYISVLNIYNIFISRGGYDKIEKAILEVWIELINENSFFDYNSLITIEFPDSLIELGKGSTLKSSNYRLC